jgi:putative ABC transport system permease protein
MERRTSLEMQENAGQRNKDAFKNAVSLAWDSILAHKLRSFLTLLGVIIGVASVILVGAAIDGLGSYAEQSVAKAFGSESYLIAQVASAGNMTRKEYFDRLKQHKPMKLPENQYLRDVNAENTLYSPYAQRGAIDIKRENITAEESNVYGVSSTFPDIRDLKVTEGRFFTDQEERAASTVAVIGDETRSILFPDGGSPLGKLIRIQGSEFTVVGVQEKLGSAFGQSQDKTAYIPVSAYNRIYGTGNGFAIFARPKPGTGLTMQQSLDSTRIALRNRFHSGPGKPDKFDTLTPDAIRGFIDNLLSLVAAVVVPVTGISLVVGGIVIMNIMLVSVTERTREIGIRKALGARQSDLMLQVLSESVLMSIAGGLLGVILGAILTLIIGKAFDLQLKITFPYVSLAVVVSSAVGIISGWYPASRAAKLDPITALRSE